MTEARFFENGGSQAVRLPKEYRFDTGKGAVIKKIGDIVMIIPSDKVDGLLLEAFGAATVDFMVSGRAQDELPDREDL